MLKLLLRSLVYVCIVVVLVGGIGLFGLAGSQKDFYGSTYDKPLPSFDKISTPLHDPHKPTVAVILGNTTTEALDFLVPYEMFARTEAYNVYSVASDNQLKSFTGGLEVMPHYSFDEVSQVAGGSPDIIVVPYITMSDEAKHKPVREWLQQAVSKETILLSICNGASNVADAGLLKGKSATSHWQVMGQLEKAYPETNWVKDQRYVFDGNYVASAGISAGIDATLYVISQQLGEPAAEKIAKDMNYPSYHFLKNPKMEPFRTDVNFFTTYMLNNAFQWNKKEHGVLLYNGMEEMALSSVFDTYSDTGTTRILTISSSEQLIETKYHLNLLARHQISNAPQLDKMLIPGAGAQALASEEIKQWSEHGKASELLFLHSDPNRYVFEAPIEHLAKQEDLRTANHAVKRLEYRANNLNLEGKSFSMETFGVLLMTLAAAVLLATYVDRRFICKF